MLFRQLTCALLGHSPEAEPWHRIAKAIWKRRIMCRRCREELCNEMSVNPPKPLDVYMRTR